MELVVASEGAGELKNGVQPEESEVILADVETLAETPAEHLHHESLTAAFGFRSAANRA